MENPYDVHQRLSRSNAALDDILQQGQEAFGQLQEQNDILERAREQMSSSLRQMGVSGETIDRIERVLREDKIIFYAGGVVTLVIMGLVLYLV